VATATGYGKQTHPETIAEHGKWLYAVNPAFDVQPGPTTEYEIRSGEKRVEGRRA